jgi:predicted benzoate:H+ symporter BenE
VLSLPLAAAQEMRLSAAETTSWILALYGLQGLLLTIRYRQPLLLTGNIFVLIFIASRGGRLGYPELVGASIVAGAGVLLFSAPGLTARLAAWIPAPIVLGLLAGAVIKEISKRERASAVRPLTPYGLETSISVRRRSLVERSPTLPVRMQSYQSSNGISIHVELIRDAGDLTRIFRVNPHSSYF